MTHALEFTGRALPVAFQQVRTYELHQAIQSLREIVLSLGRTDVAQTIDRLDEALVAFDGGVPLRRWTGNGVCEVAYASATDGGTEPLGSLLRAVNLLGPDELPEAVRKCAAAAGLDDATIYLTDLQQQRLAPMPVPGADVGPTLSVDGTLPGRAFWALEVRYAEMDDRWRAFFPLLDGSERIGVLAVTVDAYDEHIERRAQDFASVVALLVVSKRPYSDTIARKRRTREMTLTAEMQWALLPPMTFAGDNVVISGSLEPAYEVGGDLFDYALAGSHAALGVFDSMGHDLSSGLAASVALGRWRVSRRLGRDLDEAVNDIDRALTDQFSAERYVTGVLADLDTASGSFRWTLRGHPAPLLIRGGRWVKTLECRPSPPMGLGLPGPLEVCEEHLEPGDRVLLYTDGVVDARSPTGEFFGLERFTDFVIRQEAAGQSAPETLRRLVQAILEHQDGLLQDDATVLLLEWSEDEQRQLAVSRGLAAGGPPRVG